jgi:hypothetical protein
MPSREKEEEEVVRSYFFLDPGSILMSCRGRIPLIGNNDLSSSQQNPKSNNKVKQHTPIIFPPIKEYLCSVWECLPALSRPANAVYL